MCIRDRFNTFNVVRKLRGRKSLGQCVVFTLSYCVKILNIQFPRLFIFIVLPAAIYDVPVYFYLRMVACTRACVYSTCVVYKMVDIMILVNIHSRFAFT